MSKIRVLFLNDNTIINNHVKELLNTKENVEVVGVVASATQAAKMFNELLPDVIINLKMPNLNDGFGETYRMRLINPEVNIVVITAYVDEEDRYQTFQSVASGHLILKEFTIRELTSAINTVAKGNTFFNAEVSWIIFKKLNQTWCVG
ncbi:MAG: response regulator transcription factor [Candidatus Scalindua sp.]